MICAGIDVGSRLTKAVLWETERQAILASGTVDQGLDQEALARALFERVLDEAERTANDVAHTVATGCGRNLIGLADARITEITCHARGVHHVSPDARTIIEIGGQDSKIIRLAARGNVADFAMNDRCAAGTGRFLELLAARLGVRPEALGRLAQQGREPAVISNMCVVFAETEILGLLASGIAAADVAAGVQAAVASRVAALAGRDVDTPIVFTGGVALIPGMADALETALDRPVSVAPTPLMTGALGAAILAARRTA